MKKLSARLILAIVVSLRTTAYRRGLRPKHGSILYSPSLNLIYSLRDYRKLIKRK